MGKSAPAPPQVNYSAQAQAQGQANDQTAVTQAALNNVDQTGPLGSETYTQTSPDTFSENTTLNPQEQSLLNTTLTDQNTIGNTAASQAGLVQQSLSQPLNTSNVPGIVGSLNGAVPNYSSANPNMPVSGLNLSGVSALPSTSDFGAEAQQAQNASYANATSLLNPQFSQEQEQLNTQLADEGMPTSSTAYTNAQNNFGQQENLQYQDAANSAIAAGDSEQQALENEAVTNNQAGMSNSEAEGNFANTSAEQNLTNLLNLGQTDFGNADTAATYQNSANAQQLSEDEALQQLPLNEYDALASGSQVSMPSFGSTAQTTVGATPVFAAAQASGQQAENTYDQQVASNNANTGAAESAATTAAMLAVL